MRNLCHEPSQSLIHTTIFSKEYYITSDYTAPKYPQQVLPTSSTHTYHSTNIFIRHLLYTCTHSQSILLTRLFIIYNPNACLTSLHNSITNIFFENNFLKTISLYQEFSGIQSPKTREKF
ncbi:uncharacterized protein LOC143150316 [Ptiloglossa arizonensis]|uniref:uncharacterized protein LOC143150316 n=1 Tax=Ptiloglossa arizonensis TaxID=3350558 RepID=UPI003F9F018B